MIEVTLKTGLVITIIAFILEYIDSTLGMGYGTTLTPSLLLMGFKPLQIIPVLLVSQLFASSLAAVMHHFVGNVDFKPKTTNLKKIKSGVQKLGFIESFKKGIPLHLKITLLISTCSIIGGVIAVITAVNIPEFYLKLYIGTLLIILGLVILFTLNKKYGFSWKKITGLSLVASFNKGISGGGFGPIITGGQLLSGVKVRNAIGITSLAEALTCLVSVVTYFLIQESVDLTLAPYLMIGALASAPLSAFTIKKIRTKKMKIITAIATLTLGVITLIRL